MKTRQLVLLSSFVCVGAIVAIRSLKHSTVDAPKVAAVATLPSAMKTAVVASIVDQKQESKKVVGFQTQIIPSAIVRKAVALETARQDLLARPDSANELERFWDSALADPEMRRTARLALLQERKSQTAEQRKDDAYLRIFSLELLGQELKHGESQGFEQVAAVLVAKKWNGELAEAGHAQDLQDLLTLWIETEGKANFIQNPGRFFDTFFQGRKFTSDHAQLVMKAIFNVVGQTLMEPNFKKRLYPYFQRNS